MRTLSAMREAYGLSMRAPRDGPDFVSRWTAVQGARIHHRASRKAPPGALAVVLVHGLAVSHRYMMPFAAHLAGRYRVSAIDLPGFGLSDDPGSVLELPELTDRLAEWLTVTGTGPAVLVGNSFGCQVAVDLAVRHPALVRGLVLAGPTMDARGRTAPRQILRALRDVRHEDPSQAPILLRDVIDAGPRRVALTFRMALRDPVERKLPLIDVPVLVTRGALEPIIPQRWAEQVTGLLPRGELAVVPSSPHNVNYAAAGRLAAVVTPFLDRLAARRPESRGA
ncbi:alpha/beta hydrolase [Sphaerisporangium sp. TRM90804]|uniref:alpha/beta fold hydrolase n=1 Tax=Sphaerisporangium sp. TRM90804 TaxID=3031113 RepID=UPI00244D2B60|nr:alpha/beta hydrolase [Sphaerisporangium sp. TRM90804]MDH2426896.1 alpha/beta hydrolase [Sphaerisporangium sp. TRM90804]